MPASFRNRFVNLNSSTYTLKTKEADMDTDDGWSLHEHTITYSIAEQNLNNQF